MTARSIQRFGHLPKIPECLKNQRTSASLRDSQSLNSTKQAQALRHLMQIYYLERRCFL